MWKIIVAEEAKEELKESPAQVKKKFDLWASAVTLLGPWLKGGWRTEALSGALKGFYSARLNQKWRIIFELRPEKKVIVIRIVAHDYKSIRR